MEGIKKNRTGTVLCIDPAPRRKLPRDAKHIRAKVEDIDMELFQRLKKNDILFIDSSHTTEEARYHTEVILPNLRKGVLVHHHDFLYPYSIYYGNNPAKFGEPNVLLKFYAENQEVYEIMYSASYMRYKSPELINHLVKSYKWNAKRLPGSLWTRKKN